MSIKRGNRIFTPSGEEIHTAGVKIKYQEGRSIIEFKGGINLLSSEIKAIKRGEIPEKVVQHYNYIKRQDFLSVEYLTSYI